MGTERRHLQNIHLTITAIDERKDLRDGRKEKKVKAQREENAVAKCKGGLRKGTSSSVGINGDGRDC